MRSCRARKWDATVPFANSTTVGLPACPGERSSRRACAPSTAWREAAALRGRDAAPQRNSVHTPIREISAPHLPSLHALTLPLPAFAATIRLTRLLLLNQERSRDVGDRSAVL